MWSSQARQQYDRKKTVGADGEVENEKLNRRGLGLEIEIPLFDFGQARVMDAEQRYMRAANLLAEKAVNVRSEAREAYMAYKGTWDIARHYEGDGPAPSQADPGRGAAAVQRHAGRRDQPRRGCPGAHPGAGAGDRRTAGFLDRRCRTPRRACRRGRRRRVRLFTHAGRRRAGRCPLNPREIAMDISRRNLIRAGSGLVLTGATMVSGRSQAAAIPEAPSTADAATQPPLVPTTGPDYQPVVTLNGWTLPWRMSGDWKEFHLVAEPVMREFAPGMKAHLWGYNGQSPGPTIEAVEGDKVRIFVTNRLPENTAVHWHGQRLPNGMDGVGGLTQPHIPPGKTFVYEFQLGAAARSCTTRIPTKWCRWPWA